MEDEQPPRLPPTPAEWEAMKTENSSLRSENEDLRRRLGEVMDAVERYVSEVGEKELGAKAVQTWRTAMADARKVLGA